jgi:hypothetical protein
MTATAATPAEIKQLIGCGLPAVGLYAVATATT